MDIQPPPIPRRIILASKLISAAEHTRIAIAQTYGVPPADIIEHLTRLAYLSGARRKIRSAAKKALHACGADVAELTKIKLAATPKLTRAEKTAANRRVANLCRTLA